MVELIKRYGVSDVVERHGFVPYEESVATQKAADLLLFLDWTDNRAEGVLTGKLFEYLGSGRPIMAIGRRKDTEAASIIDECRCGRTLISPEEITAYLLELLEKKPTVDPDTKRVLFYSRENQAKHLLREIESGLWPDRGSENRLAPWR